MYVLATVEEYVAIEPTQLGDFGKAVRDHVNRVYAGKLLHGRGLVMCFYDVLERGDAMVGFYDGVVYLRCRFRVAVFRPQIGEVLTCITRSVHRDEIILSVGFFIDISAPKKFWPHNPESARNEYEIKVHEGADCLEWITDDQRMLLCPRDQVRAKVVAVHFVRPQRAKRFSPRVPIDQIHGMSRADWDAQQRFQRPVPAKPGAAPAAAAAGEALGPHLGEEEAEEEEEEEREPQELFTLRFKSMEVVVSLAGSGLGKLSWWVDGSSILWRQESWLQLALGASTDAARAPGRPVAADAEPAEDATLEEPAEADWIEEEEELLQGEEDGDDGGANSD